MKKQYIYNTLGIFLLLFMGIGMVSCNDIDDEIKELDLDRLLAPFKLEAAVSKSVDVTLTWKKVSNAQSYMVEVYTDSLKFTQENFVYVEEVTKNELVHTFDSDQQYSARIKSLSSEKDESKWNSIVFKTGFKSVFLSPELGDITKTSMILRWSAGTMATKITLKPAKGTSIVKEITAEEVAAGKVKIDGLSMDTKYTVTLVNGEKKIGETDLSTLPDGTKLKPTDDIKAILEAAVDGDKFIFESGNYLTDGEIITISKAITIKGELADYKPIIHAQLELGNATSFDMENIILDGTKADATMLEYAIRFIATDGNYGAITIEGSEIKNYSKSLLAGASSMKAIIESITINKSIVTNILTSGADGIDIRAGLVKSLNLTNSTFNNVAPGRDFIRLDDASSTFLGETSNVVIKNCTLHKVSTSKKRIAYVRFVNNTVTVTNSLFSETDAHYTDQSKTADPVCDKNNYFNSLNFTAGTGTIAKAKYDVSGNHTSLDPQFANADAGDFKIGNASVTAGDPRWIE